MQPIEILSLIPVKVVPPVIYKQKFKKFGMRSLCPDVSPKRLAGPGADHRKQQKQTEWFVLQNYPYLHIYKAA